MLKVCSYKRSGTHLLMALMEANFVFTEDLKMEAHADGRLWQETLQTKLVIPWGQLFGTHDPFESFNCPSTHMLYIYRNPLDVIRSNWAFDNKPGTLHEFASEKRIQDWKRHIEGYVYKCYSLKYEDLSAMPVGCLASIKAYFHLKLMDGLYHTIQKRVGWMPLGKILPREGYKEKTIDRFRDILGPEFMGYRI